MAEHERSIMLLALDTGFGKRSYRDEVSSDDIHTAARQLASALRNGLGELRPGYTITPAAMSSAIFASISKMTAGQLALIGIVGQEADSETLWHLIKSNDAAIGDPPQAPWCAIKFTPAVGDGLDEAIWIGNYARRLAWAWIDRIGPLAYTKS